MAITERHSALPAMIRPLNIVLSGVSSDSHTWNLVFLQLLMEYHGHNVNNLGACVPDELVIDACKGQSVDMLVVSSVNGHGHLDGSRMIKQLRATPGLEVLPCVMGGKLGTRGADNDQYVGALHGAGFDAIYSDDGSAPRLGDFVAYLADKGQAQEVAHDIQ